MGTSSSCLACRQINFLIHSVFFVLSLEDRKRILTPEEYWNRFDSCLYVFTTDSCLRLWRLELPERDSEIFWGIMFIDVYECLFLGKITNIKPNLCYYWMLGMLMFYTSTFYWIVGLWRCRRKHFQPNYFYSQFSLYLGKISDVTFGSVNVLKCLYTKEILLFLWNSRDVVFNKTNLIPYLFWDFSEFCKSFLILRKSGIWKIVYIFPITKSHYKLQSTKNRPNDSLSWTG